MKKINNINDTLFEGIVSHTRYKPFNHSFDKEGNINFQNVKILKTKKQDNFEIENTVDIFKISSSFKYNTKLKKQKN